MPFLIIAIILLVLLDVIVKAFIAWMVILAIGFILFWLLSYLVQFIKDHL